MPAMRSHGAPLGPNALHWLVERFPFRASKQDVLERRGGREHQKRWLKGEVEGTPKISQETMEHPQILQPIR